MNAFKSYMDLVKGCEDFRDDPERTVLLLARIRAGDEQAKEDFILSTLKFVGRLAATYCRRWNAWRDFDDLTQEGVEWISTGLHLYDPAKSASLESFIRSRLNFAFIDYWHDSKAINQTGYHRHMGRLVRHELEKLKAALGREPTVEELASQLELDESRVREYMTQRPVSLVGIDAPEGEDGPAGAADFNLVSGDKTPFELAELSELHDLAVRCLGREDADLLLGYIERGAAHFRDSYFKRKRKQIAAAAARKYKERLVKKLRACLKEMFKRSVRGGNHESQGTPNQQVTERVFNG